MEVGSRAFEGCDSLTDIILPEHLERLNGLFASGSWAWDTGVINITSLNHLPPSIDDGAFGWKAYENASVYVPEDAIAVYKTTFPWSKFYNILPIFNSDVDELLIENLDNPINYNAPYYVFTIDGAKIGDNLKDLSPGIYIVKQRHATKKIVIK